MSDLLDRAIALLREAGPGVHLCRPVQATPDRSDAWWKAREAVLLDYERCGVCGKPIPSHTEEEKWKCFDNLGK
jgi:hypothetical protein